MITIFGWIDSSYSDLDPKVPQDVSLVVFNHFLWSIPLGLESSQQIPSAYVPVLSPADFSELVSVCCSCILYPALRSWIVPEDSLYTLHLGLFCVDLSIDRVQSSCAAMISTPVLFLRTDTYNSSWDFAIGSTFSSSVSPVVPPCQS